MIRSRGFSMLAVLVLSGIMFAFLAMTMNQVESARRAVSSYKLQVQAQAMAQSGLRYAEAMLANHRWTKEQTFASPQFAAGGSFVVRISRQRQGWLIESQGMAGWQSCTRKRTLP